MIRVFMLSAMYLLFLSVLVSIVGIGDFPPAAYSYTFEIGDWQVFTLNLNYLSTLAMGVVFITIVGATIIGGIKVLGSGFTVPAGLVFVVCTGMFITFAMGYTLTSMLTGIPLMFQAVFVWPFLLAMLYTVIALAAGKGAK